MRTVLRTWIVLLLCLPFGCAVLAEKHKMETYTRAMDSYETAMRVSDFNVACRYVDSKVMERSECMQRYKNVKIADFSILSAKVAEDNQKVDLRVAVAYFLLDRYVLKKIEFEQVWEYQEASQNWMLTTGPPSF